MGRLEVVWDRGLKKLVKCYTFTAGSLSGYVISDFRDLIALLFGMSLKLYLFLSNFRLKRYQRDNAMLISGNLFVSPERCN